MDKLKILVADDDKLIRWSLKTELAKRNYSIVTAENGREAVKRYSEEKISLSLLDYMMPVMDGLEALSEIRKINGEAMVIMLTGINETEIAVKALKGGAHDYIIKHHTFDKVLISIEEALKTLSLRQQLRKATDCNFLKSCQTDIIYSSGKMSQVMKLASQVMSSGSPPVLLQGETGTGKNLIAEAIHKGSNRNRHPLIEINCGAIPDHLLESELFGHEKGAFTDAKTQKKGLFEIARGGTVFLDEIGEMKMSLQVKLLKLIEERKFRRIGGTHDIEIDVHVIAASNKNLSEAVKKNEFRSDLFYRLNTITISIPPLRERKEDIMPLVVHFMNLCNNKFGKSINDMPEDVAKILHEYNWPGNARELRNVIERAVLLSKEQYIDISTLPEELRSHRSPDGGKDPAFRNPDAGLSFEDVERDLIVQALRVSEGNQSQAARALKIGRDSMRRKMKKYDLLDTTFKINPESEGSEMCHFQD